MSRATIGVFVLVLLVCSSQAQIDDICNEAGLTPSLDSPFAHVPYVYGRVILKGFDVGKTPRVAVMFSEGSSVRRWMVSKTGNYCFRRSGGTGILTIEVDGIEAARRSLPSFGGSQQREDFEIHAQGWQRGSAPGLISAKRHPPNKKTADHFRRLDDILKSGDSAAAVNLLKEIVKIDPADFTAWAHLGLIYFHDKSLTEAEAAFRRCLELEIEYLPAWLYMGQIRMAQKQYVAAVEILKHTTTLDAKSARAFQLLGEAYLQSKQGTLGVEALMTAIKLDPVGMAECHLQIAHLYELAGAKQLAAKEYKLFLDKVPDHADKRRFEKFIKENP